MKIIFQSLLMRQEWFDWKDNSDYKKKKRSPRAAHACWSGLVFPISITRRLTPYSQAFDSQVRSRESFPASFCFIFGCNVFDLFPDNYFEPSPSYSQSFGRFFDIYLEENGFFNIITACKNVSGNPVKPESDGSITVLVIHDRNPVTVASSQGLIPMLAATTPPRNAHPLPFSPEWSILSKEVTNNNFAKGHYTTEQEIMERCSGWIRKRANDCIGLQVFLISQVVSGGAGSDLGISTSGASFGRLWVELETGFPYLTFMPSTCLLTCPPSGSFQPFPQAYEDHHAWIYVLHHLSPCIPMSLIFYSLHHFLSLYAPPPHTHISSTAHFNTHHIHYAHSPTLYILHNHIILTIHHHPIGMITFFFSPPF